MGLYTAEAYTFSIRNLHSLKCFCFKVSGTIDQQLLTIFLDKLPNIEELNLQGNFSHFNLDNLFNLKKLGLNGTINKDFNIGLLKTLCYQLEELRFSFDENEIISENFFDGHHFPYLEVFEMYNCSVKRLNKNFIEKFPTIRHLVMCRCKLELIEDGVFSNIKQLTYLDLGNNFLKTLHKPSFSQLSNLEELYLDNNPLENIEKDMFSNMKNLNEHDLFNYDISLPNIEDDWSFTE